MLNIQEVQEYLLSRPIRVAFSQLNDDEKNDETAIKFMCVVDFEVQRKNLYEQMATTNIPKLFQQLLGFHSYKYFTYYDYQDSSLLSGKNLQCRQCELFGPYTTILTHMATNHNISIGNKLCAYCENCELNRHFEDASLQRCYNNYLRTKAISDIEREAIRVHQVVKEFYNVLKLFSKTMDVLVYRKLHSYAGTGLRRPDHLTTYFDNMDRDLSYTITYFQRNISSKPKEKLNKLFILVVQTMCGGDALSRFIQTVRHFCKNLFSFIPTTKRVNENV